MCDLRSQMHRFATVLEVVPYWESQERTVCMPAEDMTCGQIGGRYCRREMAREAEAADVQSWGWYCLVATPNLSASFLLSRRLRDVAAIVLGPCCRYYAMAHGYMGT